MLSNGENMNGKVLIKDDVKFKEINEYTMQFLKAVIEIGNLLDRDMVVTSANDGTHGGSSGSNSLHYKNRAWDIRTHHLTGQEQQTVRQFLQTELGGAWDIVLEAIGTPNGHLHAEHDPKW